MSVDLFKGLVAVVQYRGKNEPHWRTMAAHDIREVAERYAAKCSEDRGNDWPWEYRVVDVVPAE